MASAVDHYREAERLRAAADRWLNADTGWMASMSTDERLARRDSDNQAAQVEATLALAAVMALTGPMAAGAFTDEPEIKAWHEAAGVKTDG